MKSILKGVPVNVTTKEIYDDLKVKNNLNVLDVKQLSRSVATANNDQQITRILQVFLVTFEPTVQINEIIKVRRVCYCVVSWENFRNSEKVTQCYNC